MWNVHIFRNKVNNAVRIMTRVTNKVQHAEPGCSEPKTIGGKGVGGRGGRVFLLKDLYFTEWNFAVKSRFYRVAKAGEWGVGRLVDLVRIQSISCKLPD